MEKHEAAVAKIAAQVRQFFERNEPFHIYHGSTNSTRPSKFQRDKLVDTSGLTNVLNVDAEAKVALVEPNVPMDSLVAATIPYGLLPPVVMEFPGITVGGGFAGTSGESSSFKYGFFDRTVESIEMILANGDIVTASKDNKPDLFYGAAASFGTLGVLSLLEVQLIDAKKYVELTYHPISSMPEALQKIEDTTKDPSNDYVDGILLAQDRGVICSGRLTDNSNGSVQHFSRAQDPWFYLHADKLVRSNPKTPTIELVPLVDYLFRYDRGGFWVGTYGFQYFLTPFNRLTRWMLDKYLHTRVMYHALHQSGLSKSHTIQDVAVPYPAAVELAHYIHRSFGYYPLWLCPLHQTGQSPHSPHGLLASPPTPTPTPPLLNFGVWGPGPRNHLAANRALERQVHHLGGSKWLYAHTYYPETEFWTIHDRAAHDALRARYHAFHLPTLYDKVSVDVAAGEAARRGSWAAWVRGVVWDVWPLRGLYGVFCAVLGGEYLLPKGGSRDGGGWAKKKGE